MRGLRYLEASGNSKISMQISLLMNVINIVGNAIFVFGFHWAVFGVALATLLSRIVAGIVITLLVCGKTNPIRIDKWSELKPDGSIIKKILAIGIPSGVENGMFQIGKLAVTSMVATFGTASIAANSVGYTVIDFANIPGNAMGLALITVVGQCIGAGEKKQAKQYTKKLVGLAYLGDWICNIALFLLAGTIAKCFHLSPEAVRIAEQILHLLCRYIPVYLAAVLYPVKCAESSGRCNLYHDCKHRFNVDIPCRQFVFLWHRAADGCTWYMDWHVCRLGCKISTVWLAVFKRKMASEESIGIGK